MKIVIPIIFFDLETTGVDVTMDRIVQIAAVKILPDGTRETKKTLINPGRPIPAAATEIHGITDEMVKDAPAFKTIAKSMANWFEHCDIAGFNSDSFDLPLLIEEMTRAGVDFPTDDNFSLVDVLKVERIVNSHKLGECYRRYMGVELENAHDALADVNATIAVFEKQLEKLEEIQSAESTAAAIDALCQAEKQRVDYAGKLYKDDQGVIRWSFGKNKDKNIKDDASYCNWVISSNFPSNTKKCITEAFKK